MSTLKLQYDSEIAFLIDRLGSVTQDVLLRGFGENPNTHQERRISTYFMELQVEISTKIGRLSELNKDIGIRYTRIMTRVDYTGVPTSAARPNQPTMAQPSRTKFSPNPTFMEQGGNKDRAKPWYTTASDMMMESDITIIQEWLHSGGPYASFTEPTRFIKLLLVDETGRVLSTMLKSKCPEENRYIDVESIVDTLDELISSRKTLSTRRKEFFSSYNTPGLMGKKGNKIDGFIARLSRDVTACKLERFRWTDYQIFLCINTLVTSDRDEALLAE